jgi:hypothetical protein
MHQTYIIQCIGSTYSLALRVKVSYQKSSSSTRKSGNCSHPQPKVMWRTAAGREPITCWPKIDIEGGIESSSQWDARKDLATDGGRQNRRGGDRRCTQNNLKGESLSESPKSSTYKVCQISRSNIKITHQ